MAELAGATYVSQQPELQSGSSTNSIETRKSGFPHEHATKHTILYQMFSKWSASSIFLLTTVPSVLNILSNVEAVFRKNLIGDGFLRVNLVKGKIHNMFDRINF